MPDLVIPTLMVKVASALAAGIFLARADGGDYVDDQCPTSAKFRHDHQRSVPELAAGSGD
ncbi:hypothetical protein LNQ03_20360 [Klebsiella pneumoniae subsp. pneumoniae]|nr:hypothetical protein [Klebsiella pneumoniae subsp. pneumoniae]